MHKLIRIKNGAAVWICCAILLLFPAISGMRVRAAQQPDQTSVQSAQEGENVFDAQLNLPEVYDCRMDAQKNPVIKDQGVSATCWAVTASSALEAALMPGLHAIFDEDHIVQENSFSAPEDVGGDYAMIMAYLAGWQGPVTKTDADTIVSTDKDAANEIPDELGEEEILPHVQEIRLLAGETRETFKQMIKTYGPVQTSLCMNKMSVKSKYSYYNEKTCAYRYDQKKKATHDILILGWDDTFAKENFLIAPEHDGAWICQNTWGESFGKNGIFYVSYEDANITRTGLAYVRVDEQHVYDHIYQTDPCGWLGRQGYDAENCCFANVYTAGQEETLAALGFYSLGSETTYELYVVHDFEDTDSFRTMKYLTGGTLEGMGYFTVDLPGEEELRSGERFAVVVDIKTKGVEKPVAVEFAKNEYSSDVTLDGKEGYISLYGGLWEHTEEKFQTNVCLKAYTRNQ